MGYVRVTCSSKILPSYPPSSFCPLSYHTCQRKLAAMSWRHGQSSLPNSLRRIRACNTHVTEHGSESLNHSWVLRWLQPGPTTLTVTSAETHPAKPLWIPDPWKLWDNKYLLFQAAKFGGNLFHSNRYWIQMVLEKWYKPYIVQCDSLPHKWNRDVLRFPINFMYFKKEY